jgi:hypothetical protein
LPAFARAVLGAWWWLAPLALALAVRGWWWGVVDTQPVTDFAWYFDRAASIARGDGYAVDGAPTAYWPVGWPALLGFVFAVWGPSLVAAKATNLALGALACALTAAVGARFGLGRAGACAAGLCHAALPGTWAYATVLASEPLVVVASLGALAALRPGRPWPVCLAAGVLLGVGTLARPPALLFAAAALAGAWAAGERLGRQAALAAACGVLLAVLPWTARNWAVLGAPVPVSTNGGDNLLIGHWPGATGGYSNPLAVEPRLAGLGEVERDRSATRLALGYIRRDPARSLRLVPAKLYETFLKQTDAAYWAFQTRRGVLVVPGAGDDKRAYLGYRSACQAGGWALLGLAALGALAGFRQAPRAVAASLGAVAAVALVSAVFFGNGRFGLPAAPFLAVLAAAAIPVRRSS